MQNWKLTLAYDGTAYHGWQIQPGGLKTVQGELQFALQRIVGENPLPQGSGRTDAGVHALAQVASFALETAIPAANLQRALNRTLPHAIRVVDALPVQNAFHARHSALAKSYEYRIFQGAVCSPFLAPYVHTCLWKLDLSLLDQAASELLGEQDFVSFAATDPELSVRNDADDRAQMKGEAPANFTAQAVTRSTIRTIFASAWELRALPNGQDATLVYRVRGSGFLHHMVRNFVGTMIEIGRGQFPSDAMPGIIEARSRSAAGPTAPAKGLFLHSVEYPYAADLPSAMGT